MIAVVVDFEVKREKIAGFRKAVLAQAANSLKEEAACRQFDVCVDPADETRVFLYELYDDRAAFDAHMKTKHFLSFNAEVTPWVKDKRVRVLDLAGLPEQR